LRKIDRRDFAFRILELRAKSIFSTQNSVYWVGALGKNTVNRVFTRAGTLWRARILGFHAPFVRARFVRLASAFLGASVALARRGKIGGGSNEIASC
jgi:hypothetical protein